MIKGKIHAQRYENRIENMPIGETGYMCLEEIIVTKTACFVSFDSEIFYQDEDDDFDLLYYVLVKRIGSGLTDQDFEIDVTKLDPDIYLDLETHSIYLELIKDSRFLVFHNFELITGNENPSIVQRKETSKRDDNLSKLESELQEAVESNDFEMAAKLRDKIKNFSKKTRDK